MKRELVRRIIDQQSARGRLQHFQSIARTAGLVDLVCEFIGELKRLEIWPEHFRDACAARGAADKDAELFEIYDLYQQSLREHGLFDAEGAFWSARDVLQKGSGVRGQGSGPCIRTRKFIIHHSSFIIPWWWPTASPTSPARSTKFSLFWPTARRRCLSRCRWSPSRDGPTSSPNR